MYGRTRSRSTGRFLTLAAAMLLLAVLSQQSWAAGVRGTAKSALAPLEAQMMSLASSTDHAMAIFGDIASLRAQNQRLSAENQDLKRQLAELNAAAYDNKELRQALDFQRTFGHRTVVAEVVGRGPDAFSRTLQIDRGSDDGVRAGMIVVSSPASAARPRCSCRSSTALGRPHRRVSGRSPAASAAGIRAAWWSEASRASATAMPRLSTQRSLIGSTISRP